MPSPVEVAHMERLLIFDGNGVSDKSSTAESPLMNSVTQRNIALIEELVGKAAAI